MPDQVQTNAVVMTPSRMSTPAASIRTTSSVTARDGEYVILVVSAIRDVLIRGTRCLAAIVSQARAGLFSTACRIPVLTFDVLVKAGGGFSILEAADMDAVLST